MGTTSSHSSTARRATTMLVSALALSALAACGSGTSTTGQTNPTPSVPSTPAASPSANKTFPPEIGETPQTVTGTVSAVKDGCVLFTPGDMAKTWVLVGDTAALKAGDQIEVSGRLSDVMDPNCPQGLRFLLTKVVTK
jgi:hypothetical protein